MAYKFFFVCFVFFSKPYDITWKYFNLARFFLFFIMGTIICLDPNDNNVTRIPWFQIWDPGGFSFQSFPSVVFVFLFNNNQLKPTWFYANSTRTYLHKHNRLLILFTIRANSERDVLMMQFWCEGLSSLFQKPYWMPNRLTFLIIPNGAIF